MKKYLNYFRCDGFRSSSNSIFILFLFANLFMASFVCVIDDSARAKSIKNKWKKSFSKENEGKKNWKKIE